MKILGYLTLISGLLISSVAIFYSVAGLTSIFSSAVIPIIIMGTSLELAKLVATAWLKQYWEVAPRFLKIYLTTAVVVLMLITSMGIFGYLSKAHSDQALVSGDVQAKVEIFDQKIKTSKDNIDADRKALKQLDDAVDQTLGRTTDSKGATRAVSIRRSQRDERIRLTNEIETEQKNIAQLNEQEAPIKAASRKVEAEVGPIKYIAALIYGDKIDQDVLEKAVRWVIILLVIVFDPLAVSLLLASQYTFQMADDEKKKLAEKTNNITEEEKFKETFVESMGTVDPEIDLLEEVSEPVEDVVETPSEPVEIEEPISDTKIIHTQTGMIIQDAAGVQTINTAEPPNFQIINNEYIKVDGQTYHHKAFDQTSKNSQEIADKISSTYIQNEEQRESDNWTKIAKPITEEEYLEAAKQRQVEKKS